MKNKTFDVAKWSTDDIEMKTMELGLQVLPNDINDFNQSVIDELSDKFDASIGINWDTIEFAIHLVYDDFYTGI